MTAPDTPAAVSAPAGAAPPADPRVTRALEEYLAALEAGRRPSRSEFLARHADIAAALGECLDGLEFVAAAVPELQQPVTPVAAEIGGVGCAVPLGDFRIVREIGRGGMGVVYEAVQLSLGRQVALKVLPLASALDSRQLQRFKNEAQAAAQLHHGNIVPVHAVGCERGVHYYAMQYIEGHTLAAAIRDLRQQAGLEAQEAGPQAGGRPSLAEELVSGRWAGVRAADPQVTIAYAPPPSAGARAGDTSNPPAAALSTEPSIRGPAFFRTVARLGVQAAEALEHAHQLGVVHRDVKPANLLVDGRGHLWITDFGLAQVRGDAKLTITGDLLGTLRYMSPEQALANRVAIDHRTDIYSLGATLYELLTLEPAFGGSDRQELLRQIAFEEPRPPRRLNKAIPAELETVVLKALEKSPTDRYATAQELADDLDRFLQDRPIRARRPSLFQVARKWARRHPAVVWSAGTFGVLFLIALVIVLAVSTGRIEAALRRESDARIDAERAKKEVEASNKEVEASLYFQTLARVQREREAGNVGLAEQLLDDPRFQDLHGWEWHYLKRLRYGHHRPLRHTGFIWDMALSSDGRLLAAGGSDGSVKLWDTQTWEEVRTFQVPGGSIHSVALGPGGRRLATATDDGRVKLWDVPTGAELCTLDRDEQEGNLKFSPDGRWIVSGAGGSVKIWDSTTGVLLRTRPADGVTCLAFSPDGQCLAVGNRDRTVTLWDTVGWTVRHRLEPHAQDVISLAFRADGAQLAVACGQWKWTGSNGEVKIWDVATGQEVRSLRGHVGGAFAVAFAPDGRRLASGGVEDALVKLWDPETGREVLTLRGHSDGVLGVVFSPDGRHLYSASGDHTVRVWDGTPLGDGDLPELHTLPGHAGPVTSVAFSTDNRRLVSGSLDRTLRVWDALTGQEIRTLPGHAGPVRGLAFTPDGKQLASVSEFPQEPPDATGEVKLWDTQTWREIPSPGLKVGRQPLFSVAFRSDGRRLAVTARDKVVVWDTVTCTPIRTLLTKNHVFAISAALSPSGRLAASAVDGTVQIWDLSVAAEVGPFMSLLLPPPGMGRLFEVCRATTDLPVRVLGAHEGRAMCVAFHPDGQSFASAGLDGTIKIWDATTFQPVATLHGHKGGVHCLAFRPDGKRLASAGVDAAIRVWDTTTHQEVFAFRGHTDAIYAVAYSPDGRWLASGGWDGTVKIWDAEPLRGSRRWAIAGPDD
jgi:WD40 repeat protein/serine/threonine protein kinase